MSKSVAITPMRDRFPAWRYLPFAVVSIAVLCLSGAADARSKAKLVTARPQAVSTAVAPSKVTEAAVASPASLHANDSVTPKTVVAPNTALRGGLTVGKASTASTADIVVEPAPSAAPQRPKDWYPESHSYLRPYHYKWRYWTPG